MGYCQEDDESPDPTMQMTEGRYQSNLGFYYTWAVLHPIDAVIHAQGVPTKYWVHRNEHTFQKPDISF